MKSKILLILVFLVFSLALNAQTITVKSFQLLQDDQTATSAEGKRIDQNGSIAALIKIKTAETGINFEGGTLGIVDAKQLADEVWVWVPRAARKITIKHPKLGVLRDYRYPVEIKEGVTYEMVLKIEKTVEEVEIPEQFLTFKVSPPNAVLEVNDETWVLSDDGSVSRLLELGPYSYKISAEGYHSDAGMVKLDDPKKPAVVTVDLRPNHSNVTLEVDKGAEIWENGKIAEYEIGIYVDGEYKDIEKWSGVLNAGTYQIECRQDKHEPSIVQKTITDQMSGQVIKLEAPHPIAGSLKVECKQENTLVLVNGKAVGEAPVSINLFTGTYDVRVVKEGYYTAYSDSVVIKMDKHAQIQCELKTSTDPTFIVNGVPFVMKYVEGGTFLMGNDSNWDEKPVHEVTVSSFFIGETEVTESLWFALAEDDDDPYHQYRLLGDDYPMKNLNFSDCVLLIERLNQKTGKNFRLPTEAEWEYAARGGKLSKGYRYAGSNELDSVSWNKNNASDPGGSYMNLHPVKQKKPNELGLYDMCGNVAEICQDLYGRYDSAPQTNPQGPSKGEKHVIRGGESGFVGTVFSRRELQNTVFGNTHPSGYGRTGTRLVLSE